ncbi:MAG TPA: hypothetical protein VF903_11355, partial [Nitrospirota bacterium]
MTFNIYQINKINNGISIAFNLVTKIRLTKGVQTMARPSSRCLFAICIILLASLFSACGGSGGNTQQSGG